MSVVPRLRTAKTGQSPFIRMVLMGWLGASLVLMPARPAPAAELTAKQVIDAINSGRDYLLRQQHPDGSFHLTQGGVGNHVVGVTAICTLALINTGLKSDHPKIAKALTYLRKLPDSEVNQVYDTSLVIMALVAAKDPVVNDQPKIARLASYLARSQILDGNTGSWSYSTGGGLNLGGDRSNAQYAVLGLREAAEAGVPVDRLIWTRIRDHWVNQQNPDGGWNYTKDSGNSTGSMTVAGVATLSIVEQMLMEDKNIAPDGTPPCCQPTEPNKPLERGLRWLATNFTPLSNPGSGQWLLYYLYGVERAGRLSGQRFFGEHDWYREGAEFLVRVQAKRTGAWPGVGPYEGDPVIATSFALLFLSKGLAPVLINKLKYGPPDPVRPNQILGDGWNHHPRDARNLTEYISGRPLWPTLLTAQEVDIRKAAAAGSAAPLAAAPVLYLTGDGEIPLEAGEIALLKEYMSQGGFLFAVAGCQSAEFEDSLRALLPKIMPPGESELKRLGPEHTVYRSEFLLDPDGVTLYGVESGCRTPVIYSPEDIGCLWQYWSRHEPPKRNPNLKAKVIRSTQIGVNVIAYATGREPPNKLDSQAQAEQTAANDRIERGLLQVAEIKHTGGWDAAPRAVRNLLTALNETAGVAANTKVRALTLGDNNLYRYPLVYMHGRSNFQLSDAERTALKNYLTRGGVLFADACCGSKNFDASFREEMQKIFPPGLKQIPLDHDIFSDKVGQDVRRLKRRVNTQPPGQPVQALVQEADTFLEGIEIDGRLVVIYSRYDISCALERQATVSCDGYTQDDAVKLAVNVVLYAATQEVALPEEKAGGPPP